MTTPRDILRREAEVTEAQIAQMLVESPRAIFEAFGAPLKRPGSPPALTPPRCPRAAPPRR
jgi:hypothetical protein